mgnify:CR=1 FL=1
MVIVDEGVLALEVNIALAEVVELLLEGDASAAAARVRPAPRAAEGQWQRARWWHRGVWRAPRRRGARRAPRAAQAAGDRPAVDSVAHA